MQIIPTTTFWHVNDEDDRASYVMMQACGMIQRTSPAHQTGHGRLCLEAPEVISSSLRNATVETKEFRHAMERARSGGCKQGHGFRCKIRFLFLGCCVTLNTSSLIGAVNADLLCMLIITSTCRRCEIMLSCDSWGAFIDCLMLLMPALSEQTDYQQGIHLKPHNGHQSCINAVHSSILYIIR